MIAEAPRLWHTPALDRSPLPPLRPEVTPVNYAVIGAGRQGTAAAYDLARFGDATSIRLLDADGNAARDAAARIDRLAGRAVAVAHTVDVRDRAALVGALRGVDAALSGVPYFFNLGVARAALEAGASFNDLGGNTDVVREELALDADAKARGVSIVPDCGLAPGMGNTLAVYGMTKFDRPTDVRIFCGGLPQQPKGPLGYKLVFSLEGLTNEYTGEAVLIRAGRRTTEPAFTGLESVTSDELGPLEAFTTSGGSSTCPWTFEGTLDTYEYKTLRWPGHFAKLRPLIELGFLDRTAVTVGGQEVVPRQLAHALLAKWIDYPDDPDLVVLRVDVAGDSGGRRRTYRIDILDRQDPKTGFTAMERTTAFPAAIVTILQAAGRVAPGARPLELAVPGGEFVAELSRRDIRFNERWVD
jgi:lysine 6-dehydrogenase